MSDCIFCQIASGKVPATEVYEDETSIAFLNIQAINPGHTLVIPREHTEDFYKLESKSYNNYMAAVQKVAYALEKTYRPKKVGIMVQGYEIDHAHIHVVPTYEPSDISSKKLLEGTALHPTEQERAGQAKKIKQNL
jgi:histidine triad (HIT) family protein